jgi:hypothetical protein
MNLFVLFADNSLPFAGLLPSANSSSYSLITHYHSVTGLFILQPCISSSYSQINPYHSQISFLQPILRLIRRLLYPLSLSHRSLCFNHLFVLFAENSVSLIHRYLSFSQLFISREVIDKGPYQAQISFLRPAFLSTISFLQNQFFISSCGPSDFFLRRQPAPPPLPPPRLYSNIHKSLSHWTEFRVIHRSLYLIFPSSMLITPFREIREIWQPSYLSFCPLSFYSLISVVKPTLYIMISKPHPPDP